jgi:hypothetical protein
MRILVCLFGTLILFVHSSSGQTDSIARVVAQFPNRIFARINSKASSLDNAMTIQTEKYLQRLARKEKKIQEKVYKLDSNAAKNLFNGTQEKYVSLETSMKAGASTNGAPLTGEYLPYADSLKTSLAY